jgi:uncharacterized protein
MDDEDPCGEEPAAERRVPALGLGVLGALGLIAALIAYVLTAGSSGGGDPSVWLSLKPFPDNPQLAASAASGVWELRRAGGNLVADSALIEDSAEGPLPTVARDGRAPLRAYARAFDKNEKQPKIAIVITGLDVGASDTANALAKLPPAITLAFAPFASDIQSWIDKARGAGHEVLIEIPMEPFDFPDSDPGPHALLVGASAAENLKRFDWALSRATGYVGVTNLLGGRFLGETSAIEPIMAETAKRGLLFFDDGANSNSLTLTAARHKNVPLATGTTLLDSVPAADAIDAKLAALESAARQDGFAIAVGSVTPITVDRVAQWASDAEAHGFALSPVSALAAVPADSRVQLGMAAAQR